MKKNTGNDAMQEGIVMELGLQKLNPKRAGFLRGKCLANSSPIDLAPDGYPS
jgi:hypothetical protein